MINENWRKIRDFPNYEISNLGRVRSLQRKDVGVNFNRFTKKYVAQITVDGKSKSLGSFNTKAEAIAVRKSVIPTKKQEPKILAQTNNSVTLYNENGKHKMLIADLVADAFFDRKDYLAIKHIDGDSSNNRLDNLKPLYSKECQTKQRMETDVALMTDINFNMNPAEVRYHCERVVNNRKLLQKAIKSKKNKKSGFKKSVEFYINEILARTIEYDIGNGNISKGINTCIYISILNGGLE